ncbi:MAG: 2-oxoglutarate and iron-dependent oxygenase domain-containing protein [Amphritea sp.]
MHSNNQDYAAAKTLSLEDIPVIDFAPLIENNEIEEVSRQLISAARNTGFFYIRNHGIDQRLIDNALNAAKGFFRLPAEDKSRVAVNTSQRGWLAPGMATLEGARTHDLKEIFFTGPEHWSAALLEKKAQIPLIADNLWPAFFPALKENVLPYYDAVCQLGHQVLKAIAVGMGEEADFFAKRYTSPLGRGQLVYYPRSSNEDEAEERFGAAAHTDFGVITLLLQDDNGGLQVLNKQDEWVEAQPIAGTFVCNIGDLLHRWTNDHLSSNLHRVINRSGNERFSMPIFFDPDPTAIIDSRDFNKLAHEDPKYSAVSVADYIDSKNRKAFAQYK